MTMTRSRMKASTAKIFSEAHYRRGRQRTVQEERYVDVSSDLVCVGVVVGIRYKVAVADNGRWYFDCTASKLNNACSRDEGTNSLANNITQCPTAIRMRNATMKRFSLHIAILRGQSVFVWIAAGEVSQTL